METLAIVRWVRSHPLAHDVALALAVAALGVTMHLAGTGSGVQTVRDVQDPTWWTVPLVIATAAPLVWRRTRPVVTAAVIVVAQIVCEVLVVEGTGWFGVLVAAYSLGAYAEHRRAVAAVGLLSLIGALLISGWLSEEIGLVVVIGSAAIVVAGFLFGDNVRRRRLHVNDLAERAERAEREQELIAHARVRDERSRLARELHDVVAHSVSVMIIQTAAARRNVAARPDEATTMLHNVELTGRRAMDELRRVLGVLRSDDDRADDPATSLGPQPGLADVSTLIADVPDLPVRLVIDPTVLALPDGTGVPDGAVPESAGVPDGAVPDGVGMSVYRLIQEALTNVRRHAGQVDQVDVTVTMSAGVLDVRIDDDGRGAANATAIATRMNAGRTGGADAAATGFGIAGMHERAVALGGHVSAGPRPGGGWRVHARLPIDAGTDITAGSGSGTVRSGTPGSGAVGSGTVGAGRPRSGT